MAADSASFESSPKARSPKDARMANPSRRLMLQVIGLGAAGFAVGCTTAAPPVATPVATGPMPTPPSPAPALQKAALGPFVKVGSDNTVTVLLKHIEFGQGVSTGLTTIVAEEIDADWSQMRFEHAPAEVPTYGNGAFGNMVQGTGGSTAIANSWMQLRQAGAGAREMLRQAAAKRFGVDASAVAVSHGKCTAGGKTATFGELAADAAKIAPPDLKTVKLKDPSQFRYIGKERGADRVTGRADTAGKINGSAQYALDYHPEGLLIAVVARSPKFGGKVASLDDSAAKAVKGVTDVFQISNGVAVVATNYWAAKKGREALKIAWDDAKAETRSSEQIFADYRKLLDKPGHEARKAGKGLAALKGPGKVITADFEFPYLAHAPMEPMNATIEYKPGQSCLITSGSQMPTVDQAVACAILGLKQDQVKVNTTLAGGSFGRKATADGDLITEAAQIAKHLNGRAPVKLMWSREDDIRSGKYRPMAVHRMTARISKGKLEAWGDRTAVQSIMEGTAFLPAGQPDLSAVEGSNDIPYAIPNISVDVTWPKSPVTVLWWRSVGHTHTAFAKEHFFDVVAREMKADPVELRRAMLKDEPRLLGVLNLAAEKAGWGKPLGPNRYRGVSVHKSFDTYVSEVAEITMKPGGGYSVDRVVAAVDCGVVINPDVVRAQIEGGVGMGLSAISGEQVTIKDGAPVQTNFFDYPPLRMSQMPKVEVYIVPSAEAPTGVGEPGLPPLGPAVANALFAATGKPITKLPIGPKIETNKA